MIKSSVVMLFSMLLARVALAEPATIRAEDILHIRIYGIAAFDSTHATAEPDYIRKNPSYYQDIYPYVPTILPRVKRALSWLRIEDLKPWDMYEGSDANTNRGYVVPAILSSMVMVFDVEMNDGKKHSFYANMGHLYDESLTYRRRTGCRFLEMMVLSTGYGVPSDFGSLFLDACKVDPDRPTGD